MNDSEGIFKSGAGYEIMSIAGRRAVLEISENLPMSLAVKYDTNTTITIETNALDKSGLVNFAEKLLTVL